MTKLQIYTAVAAGLAAFFADLHSFAKTREQAAIDQKPLPRYDWLLAVARVGSALVGGFGFGSLPGAGS